MLRVLVIILAMCAILVTGSALSGWYPLHYWIAAELEDRLGREVRLAGPINIDVFGKTAISLSQIEVANPDWANEPNLLMVESLYLELDLRGYWDSRPLLRSVSSSDVSLHLETAQNGNTSWRGIIDEKEQDEGRALPPILIEGLEVTFRRPTGKPYDINFHHLSYSRDNGAWQADGRWRDWSFELYYDPEKTSNQDQASVQLTIIGHGGTVSKSTISALETDIITMLFAEDEPQEFRIDCAIMAFALHQDRAEIESLVFDSKVSTITGDGHVRYAEPTIDIVLKSHPKDISLLSTKSPVRIEGPLENPDIYIDKKSVIERAAAALVLGSVLAPAAVALPFLELGLETEKRCGGLIDNVLDK